MTNIALDTNIWIYLACDTFFDLWLKLKEMKENDEIRIIVNDIILKEWKRNKKNTLKSLTANIQNEYKSAKKLSNYLSGKTKENYLKTISEYKDETYRIAKAKARVKEIEVFMKSCTTIRTTKKQKLFIADLAINNLPPFENKKNNYNDALIIRNICEYVNGEMPYLYDLIYVSNNPNDFTDKETKEVHKCLLKGLNPIRLKNVTELGEALLLAPEIMEDFDDWLEDKLDNEAMNQLDFIRGK